MKSELYKGSYHPTTSHQVMRKPHLRPNSDLGTKLFLENKHTKNIQNSLDSGLEHPPTLSSFRFPINILHDRKIHLTELYKCRKQDSVPFRAGIRQQNPPAHGWTQALGTILRLRGETLPPVRPSEVPLYHTVVGPYTLNCYCDHLRTHF